MSWPATPLLTFIDASAPACDASFLNSLQAGVNGLCLGTYSYKAISVDGTGGVATAPIAGSISASGNISTSGGSLVTASSLSTGAGGASVTHGVISKDLIPIATAIVEYTGGNYVLYRGVNIAGVANGTNSCIVTLSLAGSGNGYDRMPVIANSVVNNAYVTAFANTTTQITAYAFTMAGAATNAGFSLVVFNCFA